MEEHNSYCDLMCRHAEISRDYGVDGSGSCRTFIALYCQEKKTLVSKNAPCKEKVERDTFKAEN